MTTDRAPSHAGSWRRSFAATLVVLYSLGAGGPVTAASNGSAAELDEPAGASARGEPVPQFEPVGNDGVEKDPFERVNRVTFNLNNRLLRYTVRPAAKTYRFLVPRPLRDGFRNALDNLDAPLNFGNLVLEGESADATRALARFLLNTTLGLGGTIDVSRRLGIPRREADFGHTLGAYGVGEGPYLVLPLIGPAIPRDSAASFAQGAVDPFNLWVTNTDYGIYAFIFRFVLGSIDLYSRHMDELDTIEAGSLDYYAALRNIFLQRRRAQIRKIVATTPAVPAGIDYTLDFDEPEPDAGADPAAPLPVPDAESATDAEPAAAPDADATSDAGDPVVAEGEPAPDPPAGAPAP